MRKAILVAVLIAAAALFTILHLRLGMTIGGIRPGEIYAGTASLPFQYRYLVPLLVRGIVSLTGWDGPPEHMQVFAFVDFLATAASFAAALALLRQVGASRLWLLALMAMLLANYTFAPYENWWLPYDIPALLFATLGLLWLREERWRAYYLLLPFGILNRETAAILIAIFTLTQAGKMAWPRYAGHLLAQLAILVGVKGALWIAFHHNIANASAFYDQLNGQYYLLRNLDFLRSGLAFTFCAGLWLPFLLALGRLRDSFLRRAVWVIPPFLLVMLLVGNLWEFRIFTELLPLMMAVMAAGLEPLLRKWMAAAATRSALTAGDRRPTADE